MPKKKIYEEERKLVPFRIRASDYESIRKQLSEEGITFQKLTELLVDAYQRGNKHLHRIVSAYAEEKRAKGNSGFDLMERDELRRLIQAEYSPLKVQEVTSRDADEDIDTGDLNN